MKTEIRIQKRFTLVELLVAFAILAFALSTIVVIIQRYNHAYFNASTLEKATLLARSKMEEIRLKTADILPSGTSGEFRNHAGYNWSVRRDEFETTDAYVFERIILVVFYPLASGDQGQLSLQIVSLQEKSQSNVQPDGA